MAAQVLKGKKGPYHPLTGLLAIHETLRDGIRSEDLIPRGGAAMEDHCKVNSCSSKFQGFFWWWWWRTEGYF